MTRPRFLLLSLGLALGLGCADASNDMTGPSASLGEQRREDVRAAIAAQERHTAALLRIPGVIGTAVGLRPDGRAAVRVFVTGPDVRGIPAELDRIPVTTHVTSLFMAFSDPTTRARPAPLGYSVGHPSITAGTIGGRVKDAAGNVYILSNNHVLAASNAARLGDPALQPGAFDGGTAADQIGSLFAFNPIDFSLSGRNTMDAAIALSTTTALGNATPSDDGYGMPASAIFGDADHNGSFDDITAALGVNVQKYGRTTKHTRGQVTAINATVEICYEVLIIFCVKSAIFVDQLIIEPGTFSGGGDSGSLIATDDANKNPVALLFAGSSTQTVANRIDLVLNYFGITVDGADALPPPPPPPPPPAATDVAVSSVTAPASVTQGATVDVAVTVRNGGTTDVSTFAVTLVDATGNVPVGTQNVPGLAAGATTTLTFAWNTAAALVGAHTLTAAHTLLDDNAANNEASATVQVVAPSTLIHVGDLESLASSDGSTWFATVEILVHDANHTPVRGATITGVWSPSGGFLSSDTCTTGDLGGNGTCIVLSPALRKRVGSVTFTVRSVTMSGQTYVPSANHDLNGNSDGTTITVRKP